MPGLVVGCVVGMPGRLEDPIVICSGGGGGVPITIAPVTKGLGRASTMFITAAAAVAHAPASVHSGQIRPLRAVGR
ncbi:MAG: hypothetical protein JWP03_2420 [Phycisphaerales bacterium]|nr:hypothetical protein [Phycisphaerales bacterium]